MPQGLAGTARHLLGSPKETGGRCCESNSGLLELLHSPGGHAAGNVDVDVVW